MFGPCCCGISLRKGVKIIAILLILVGAINFILGWIVLFMTIFYFSGGLPKDPTDDEDLPESSAVMLGIKCTFTIVQAISEICVSIWLLLGAKQRNIDKCKTWLIIQYVVLAIYVILFFLSVSVKNDLMEGIEFSFFFLGIICTCYMIWVVRAFIVELHCSSNSFTTEVPPASELV